MTLDEMLRHVHPDEVRDALKDSGVLPESTRAIYYSLQSHRRKAANSIVLSRTIALSAGVLVSIRMESTIDRGLPGNTQHDVDRHAVPLSAVERTWARVDARARRPNVDTQLRECEAKIHLNRPLNPQGNEKLLSLPLNDDDYNGESARQAQQVLSFVRSVEQALGD